MTVIIAQFWHTNAVLPNYTLTAAIQRAVSTVLGVSRDAVQVRYNPAHRLDDAGGHKWTLDVMADSTGQRSGRIEASDSLAARIEHELFVELGTQPGLVRLVLAVIGVSDSGGPLSTALGMFAS